MIFCKNCHWCLIHHSKGEPNFSAQCCQGFKLEVINKNASKPWKKPKYEIVQKGLKVCSFRILKRSGGALTRLQRIMFDVDIV